MKKKMLMLAGILTAAALALTGCEKDKAKEAQPVPAEQTEETENTETAQTNEPAVEEKNYLYLEDINIEDYVTLGEYKGVTINKPKPDITEEEVEAYIDYLLRIDPPSGAADGDTVTIDYEGKENGVAFQGGTAAGAELTLGSHSFIEGFEEGLIGAKAGETRDLNLTFPEDYPEPTLAGKEVVFTVKVNRILAVNPQEMTEEYVKGLDLSLNTVEEFRQYAYDQMYEQEAASIDSDMERVIVSAIVEKCEMKQELPEDLLNRYVDNMLNNLTMQAQTYGISLEEYMMAATGLDEAGYMEEMRKESKAAAKQYVIMQAIADSEGISPTEEEMNEEIKKQAEAAGYEDNASYREMLDEKGFREYLMSQRVIAMLVENTTVVDE